MAQKLSNVMDTDAKNPATGQKVKASDTVDYTKFVIYGLTALSVGGFAFNWVKNQVNQVSSGDMDADLGGIAGGL